MNKDQIEPHVVKLPPHPSGHAGVAILVVTHTDRQGRVRIISARPAKRAERTGYEEAIRPGTEP